MKIPGTGSILMGPPKVAGSPLPKMPGSHPLFAMAHHRKLAAWRNAIAEQAFRFGHPQFMAAAKAISGILPGMMKAQGQAAIPLGTNAPAQLGTSVAPTLGTQVPGIK